MSKVKTVTIPHLIVRDTDDRRLKRFLQSSGMTMDEVLNAALIEYLDRHENK